ncbi:hypothetical protein ACFVTY_29250 [Streptomyces sp. NPDC058067]|uniref:hypothetical protein n=1 Tax=Streptomyces sp. NPDC058067 TaxID=3346324 RepID=UPI0036EE42A6
MEYKYKYRLRSPMGGLAADLTAETLTDHPPCDYRLQIDRNLWLVPPKNVHWRDSAWLSFGLSAHADALHQIHPADLTIRVTDLTFPLANFRSEVSALAMDGWLRDQFPLPDIELRAEFNPTRHSHDFYWGGISSPFEDANYL